MLHVSTMKLREEEKWQRILWRDTLTIMNGGQAINRYTLVSQIYIWFICGAADPYLCLVVCLCFPTS